MAERLQKVMANAGVASRRASEKLIQEGRVMVNGVVVTELGTKVESDDSISVDGKLLKKDEKKVYYLLYKPRGVISAAKDNKGREVVTDYLKDVPERLYPVGRLDYDTSGLLILTNDGDFANQMMHPRYKVDKTYVAKVEGLITPDSIKKLRNGVVIDGKPTSRARAKIISRDAKKNTSIVSLTIHEGRYHQVKKMFDAVGHKVQKLSRITYGTLTLDGLTSGEYRELSHNEVRELLKLINNK
ncbi:pseudouridine synthase [Ligilactobacillus salivarius]|uniref:Pseudouridine synthase n=1 Tax=Ligilactobacillus salivarius TaxID=1624 RepID=A0AAW7N5M1_9LACO|nr:pseudouridine synthase [Ligilactobacillus salivarius]MDN4833366.1 pseudouridine synthase [Ligilactobacillus salivarius]